MQSPLGPVADQKSDAGIAHSSGWAVCRPVCPYLATVRTKAFLIGLVVAPLLFGGSILGLALFKDRPDIKDRRIAVVDATGVVAGAVIQAAQAKNAREMFDKKTGSQVTPRYVFEVAKVDAGSESAQRLALSDRVRHFEDIPRSHLTARLLVEHL